MLWRKNQLALDRLREIDAIGELVGVHAARLVVHEVGALALLVRQPIVVQELPRDWMYPIRRDDVAWKRGRGLGDVPLGVEHACCRIVDGDQRAALVA
ncbi:MAG: hypothetical protein GEV06_25515 [Luteitalea sp.]|nr:hypothetical protein [Luteitalea sp.]